MQGRQTAVEFCCLTASTLRYHLLSNPQACVLGIDLLPEQHIRKLVENQLPIEHRDQCMRRFAYAQQDISKLTWSQLSALTKSHLKLEAFEVDHYHAGWPCQSTSTASSQTPAWKNFTPHRWPDARTVCSSQTRRHTTVTNCQPVSAPQKRQSRHTAHY